MVDNAHAMDRRFRIYDGSTPRNYINCVQLTPPSMPLTRPRSESTVVGDGGGPGANMTSYVNDVLMPWAPVPISFQVLHMPAALEVLYAFGNVLNRGSWVIGGVTWAGVAANAIGNVVDARGNSWPARAPDDVLQSTRMVSCVANTIVHAGILAGTPLVVEWKGCVINTVNWEPGDGQMLYFNMEGMCYGEIVTDLTDWPAGTECFPS